MWRKRILTLKRFTPQSVQSLWGVFYFCIHLAYAAFSFNYVNKQTPRVSVKRGCIGRCFTSVLKKCKKLPYKSAKKRAIFTLFFSGFVVLLKCKNYLP